MCNVISDISCIGHDTCIDVSWTIKLHNVIKTETKSSMHVATDPREHFKHAYTCAYLYYKLYIEYQSLALLCDVC